MSLARSLVHPRIVLLLAGAAFAAVFLGRAEAGPPPTIGLSNSTAPIDVGDGYQMTVQVGKAEGGDLTTLTIFLSRDVDRGLRPQQSHTWSFTLPGDALDCRVDLSVCTFDSKTGMKTYGRIQLELRNPGRAQVTRDRCFTSRTRTGPGAGSVNFNTKTSLGRIRRSPESLTANRNLIKIPCPVDPECEPFRATSLFAREARDDGTGLSLSVFEDPQGTRLFFGFDEATNGGPNISHSISSAMPDSFLAVNGVANLRVPPGHPFLRGRLTLDLGPGGDPVQLECTQLITRTGQFRGPGIRALFDFVDDQLFLGRDPNSATLTETTPIP